MRATIKPLTGEKNVGIISTIAQSGYEYGQYYETSYSSSSELPPEVAAGILGFVWILLIATYVISAIGLMRIFKKAGTTNTWAAWVPIYNNWKLLEVGGQQGFWAALAVIPIVSIVSAVFLFIAMYNIGLKLGKSGAFFLLAIFLPIVWLLWLAFDKSTWNDAAGAPSLTPVRGSGVQPTTPGSSTPNVPPVPPTPPTPPTA